MKKINLKDISSIDCIVKAMVTDLSWWLREIIFPWNVIEELCASWIAYDGSSFEWINEINNSDSIVVWDKSTIIKCPENIRDTNKEEFWIICDIFWIDWKPHPNCSRSKLKELQKELSKKWSDWKMYMWSEPEAFFVEKKENLWDVFHKNSNYFNPRSEKSFIMTEIANVLNDLGYELERWHTECWDDQFEINWKFDLAERTADKIQMFKLIAHKIARKHSFDVTFLPKPFPNINGSGMHCHISVANKEENLFFAKAKKEQKDFSDNSLYFLQWIIDNLRNITAIANRTEVSYSRLVPWFEAPCIVAIWERNRSVACRIPAIASEKAKEKGLRVEFRSPDPLANPYLLASSFIITWLDWLEKKSKFIWFCNENLFEYTIWELNEKWYKFLPRNLWEAYNEFIKCHILKKSLWESMFYSYANIILQEIDDCQAYANSHSMKKHYFS